MTSLTETLASFLVETGFAAIPPEVIVRAKVSLAHNLSVALAGRSREMVAAAAAARYWSDTPEATLWRGGGRASVEGAAFANACLMHARSQDDTHAGSTSHPGAPVMATALAMGEAIGSSGAEVLRAIVLGYEALGRIGRDFDHLATARGYRAAALFGGFGATAAASALLRLSAAQTAHALGLATHMAGGTAQVWIEGSAEGPLQLGFAARNGITAARLAQIGATAARHALDGPSGLYRAVAGTNDAPREALHGLGSMWQISEATVKPYPACAILQGPVDAALNLARLHDFSPDSVTDIALALNPFEAAYPGVDNPGPFASAIATKLSAQFCLALALDSGGMTPDGLLRLTDPRVLALAGKVRVIADPGLLTRLSRLAVTLRDGRCLQAIVDSPAGRPGLEEIGRFAHRLGPEMAMEPAAIDRLLAAVDTLDHAPELGALLSAICP